MNIDLEQALNFAEYKNYEKLQKNYEYKRKRRLAEDESSTINDMSIRTNEKLSNVLSSLMIDGNTNSKPMDNIISNHLTGEDFEEEMIDEDIIFYFDKTDHGSINDSEIIDNLLDNSETCSDCTNAKQLLHNYTNISTEDFCSKLLSILRDSHTSKCHANRLLSFWRTVFPVPNDIPKTIEKVIETLNIDNNVYRRYIICTICNNVMSFSEKTCSKCSSYDNNCFALVYDMDIEQLIKTVYKRLLADIIEYREQLYSTDDSSGTNDVGFNNVYLELAKKNANKNFITFLLHVDGISLSNSSTEKMWILTGSILELRPSLRTHRYNMVVFSFWFSKKEPNTQIWLKNCCSLIKLIKTKGDYIIEKKFHCLTQ